MQLKSNLFLVPIILVSSQTIAASNQYQGYHSTIGVRGSYVQTQFEGIKDKLGTYGIEVGMEFDTFEDTSIQFGFDAYFETGKYEPNRSIGSVNFDTFAFMPKVHKFFTDDFDLFIKAGVANWVHEPSTKTKLDGYDPIVGVGTRYHIQDTVYIGGEYSYLFADENNFEFDTSYFTLKVGYRF
ncbi:TPA: porin family protein [Vibrio parahaemolyticus]|nr:porin family protein [Vibrio parahaemolyticus]